MFPVNTPDNALAWNVNWFSFSTAVFQPRSRRVPSFNLAWWPSMLSLLGWRLAKLPTSKSVSLNNQRTEYEFLKWHQATQSSLQSQLYKSVLHLWVWAKTLIFLLFGFKSSYRVPCSFRTNHWILQIASTGMKYWRES